MQKFDYVLNSADGKTNSAVAAEAVAHRVLNRAINMVAIAEDGTGLRLNLSDGGSIKFRLKASGADVIYDPA
jgi:hypothetical protein